MLEDNNRKVADLMTAVDSCGTFYVVQDVIDLIYTTLKDTPWRSVTPFFTKLKKLNVLSKEEIAESKKELKNE